MDEANKGYNGLIPPEAFSSLSWEAAKIMHGKAMLTLFIRDGKLARFTTSRERSFAETGLEQKAWGEELHE